MKKKVLRFLPFLIFSTFILISLGGAVRSMHAGLACPDWPLCFGDVIPDYQIQVYYEFIHRVIAGIVGLSTMFLAFIIFRDKEFSKYSRRVMMFAIAALLIQIVMGGLTVLKLLNSGIVTSHLGFGMLFFSSLVWLYYSIAEPKITKRAKIPLTFKFLLGITLPVVFVQIIIGGLVSTNYAGVACPDFPLCMGEFIPTLSGLMGLQVIHRLGAYTVAITIFTLYLYASTHREKEWMDKKFYNNCGYLVMGVITQIALGIMNVLYKTPPLITVLHLAVAATILGLTLKLLFMVRSSFKG
jgi:cytochrome c oxidase assembly protein subunit 15